GRLYRTRNYVGKKMYNIRFYVNFRLAQERYRIKTGWIDTRRREINTFLQYTGLYEQQAYVKTVLY
ncbi:MAG TPA: hypothetical protein VJ939_07170, partial [Bacteroidales bacterium]|nr:hypothetical protein [Bacteroidales bacterium]